MADSPRDQPPALHLDAEFHDFDELAEAIEGWDLDWKQLDRGRLEASLQQIRTSCALLTRVGFSRKFYQRGGTPPGFLTIGIIGEEAASVNWCGQRASGTNLLAFPTGGEYESMSQPGFGAHTLSFSQDLLESIARSLDLPKVEHLRFGSYEVLTSAPGSMVELREKLRAVFSSAAAEPSVLVNKNFRHQIDVEIPTLLLKALGSASETRQKLSSSARSRVARSAVTLIAESSGEPLTVDKICSAIGVSQRTLQYAFREQFDVTPKQYLQAVRLNNVRQDLRRWGPSVKIADVANRWGFWHLGQFAGAYRSHFGELPSETRSRV